MGRILLVFRLAARDLRRGPVEAALLLVAIAAATATLPLGLVLHGMTNDRYERTREATAGPDVVASVGPNFFREADPASMTPLIDAPEVIAHSGPYPLVGGGLAADGAAVSRRNPREDVIGGAAGQRAAGRHTAEASVDRPRLTQGSWVRDGGVVIESGFADALGIGVGDRVTLRTRLCGAQKTTDEPECPVATDRSFRVVGVAVTAAARPYPDVCFAPFRPWFAAAMEHLLMAGPPDEPADGDERILEDAVEPGLVWLTKADVRS